MANNLFTNMNRLNQVGSQPKNTVDSIEKNEPEKHKRGKRGKYKKLPKEVEFPTNLKISNRQRNALRAICMQGKAKNQKDAIDFLLDNYKEGLNNESKTTFESFVTAMNSADTERYKQEHQ